MSVPVGTKAFVTVTPVVHTMPADLLTPLAVYLRLAAGSTHSFLLESVEGGRNLTRYSFIGADPVTVVRGTDRQIEITQNGGRSVSEIGLIDFLKEHFEQNVAKEDQELPAFVGGAIGYLGFDCCEWFEPSLRQTGTSNGDGAFMIFRSIVAFDHARQFIRIISLAGGGEAGTDEVSHADAAERNLKIQQRLEGPMPDMPANVTDSRQEPASNWSRQDFEAAVSSIKELIYAGECYQAVLSQRFTRKTSASPFAIYRALRSLNPSPYMFLLRFDGRSIIGASPEMLVRCQGRRLDYRPIAGTRARGKTAAEDDQLANEMQQDKKEVSEHVMLVDLGRNDLGRVAEYGSVRVETLMSVEKYSHVQHLVSSLSAELRNGLSCFDALAACFPAGTVSGAPKVRATEIIRGLEPTPRGVYAGAIGYFDYTGNMDTCISIRTLTLENGVARIQAGAGIVADSIPAMEFDETVNKAAGLMRAIDLAEGRT